MVKTGFTAIAGAAVLALSACSAEDDANKAGQAEQTTQATKAAPAPSAPGASLSVKADKTHAVQPNDEITLTISLTNFRLAPDSIGAANQNGAGHYRIYLDDGSGDGYLAVGAEPTVKVTIPDDISDGSHDLRVVLHNNDKSPVEPPVEGSVLLIVYRL